MGSQGSKGENHENYGREHQSLYERKSAERRQQLKNGRLPSSRQRKNTPGIVVWPLARAANYAKRKLNGEC